MPQVKLFARLRKFTGLKVVSVKGDGIREAISELVNQYPAMAIYLIENGLLHPKVIITLNGHLMNDMDTPLTEQDEIALFPPIGGG